MISQRFTLNKQEARQWLSNALQFLAPLGVLYFGSVAVLLQDAAHRFTTGDLIPNQAVIGAMVLYVMNTLYDLSRKFAAGK